MSVNNSYSIGLEVRCEAPRAFDELSTRISDWWGDQDHPAEKVGDVFTVSWGEPWYQFQVKAFHPPDLIVWECIDANQIIGDLKGVQKEWVGTQLQWTITPSGENIKVHLKHRGLVPAFVCYDFCSSTWDRFITVNLKKYLER